VIACNSMLSLIVAHVNIFVFYFDGNIANRLAWWSSSIMLFCA
jgi:hypothetical protein